MRDIELIPVPSVPADPEVDDAAYGSTEGAGLIAADTTLTDPSFTDTKAYGRPSLGGEFGVGRAAILGADADGGAADLAVDTVVTVTAPIVPTPPNTMALGRSANNSSFLNLYPWFKTPKEGLDMNNPNPPPAADPPPPPLPHGITMPVLQLVGNDGTVQFSGPATRNVVVTLHYAIAGGPMQTIPVSILSGDTASQIAAKVRNAVDDTFGVDADGTGGTVHVVGVGGNLTAFNVTIA
jgi:hypothetical protein